MNTQATSTVAEQDHVFDPNIEWCLENDIPVVDKNGLVYVIDSLNHGNGEIVLSSVTASLLTKAYADMACWIRVNITDNEAMLARLEDLVSTCYHDIPGANYVRSFQQIVTEQWFENQRIFLKAKE